jgi:hypothetical protein
MTIAAEGQKWFDEDGTVITVVCRGQDDDGVLHVVYKMADGSHKAMLESEFYLAARPAN